LDKTSILRYRQLQFQASLSPYPAPHKAALTGGIR
jgi:hypothetical protein